MTVRSYLMQVRALRRKLFPLPKPERWLPLGVFLDDDENFLPGQEEIWQRCQRAGITPNVYIGFDPNMDGCEDRVEL